MSLVGEELRRRRIQQASEMSAGTMRRLRQIYQALSPTMPDDPAANQFVQRLDVSTAAPLVLGTKQVVAQVVRSAQANLGLPAAGDASAQGETRREGDALTEHLVRQAAGIARFLPESIAANSFLLGLGIALDDSKMLRDHPKFGGFVRLVEPDQRARAPLGVARAADDAGTARSRAAFLRFRAPGGHRRHPSRLRSGLVKELSDANRWQRIQLRRHDGQPRRHPVRRRRDQQAILAGRGCRRASRVPIYMPPVDWPRRGSHGRRIGVAIWPAKRRPLPAAAPARSTSGCCNCRPTASRKFTLKR